MVKLDFVGLPKLLLSDDVQIIEPRQQRMRMILARTAPVIFFLYRKIMPKKKASPAPKKDPCWKGYEQEGTKKKEGKTVPNCVKKD